MKLLSGTAVLSSILLSACNVMASNDWTYDESNAVNNLRKIFENVDEEEILENLPQEVSDGDLFRMGETMKILREEEDRILQRLDQQYYPNDQRLHLEKNYFIYEVKEAAELLEITVDQAQELYDRIIERKEEIKQNHGNQIPNPQDEDTIVSAYVNEYPETSEEFAHRIFQTLMS